MALQVYGRTHIRPIPNFIVKKAEIFLLSFFCLQSLCFPVVIKLSAIENVMLKWNVLGSLSYLLLSVLLMICCLKTTEEPFVSWIIPSV